MLGARVINQSTHRTSRSRWSSAWAPIASSSRRSPTRTISRYLNSQTSRSRKCLMRAPNSRRDGSTSFSRKTSKNWKAWTQRMNAYSNRLWPTTPPSTISWANWSEGDKALFWKRASTATSLTLKNAASSTNRLSIPSLSWRSATRATSSQSYIQPILESKTSRENSSKIPAPSRTSYSTRCRPFTNKNWKIPAQAKVRKDSDWWDKPLIGRDRLRNKSMESIKWANSLNRKSPKSWRNSLDCTKASWIKTKNR